MEWDLSLLLLLLLLLSLLLGKFLETLETFPCSHSKETLEIFSETFDGIKETSTELSKIS
jgi:hypothetical protein